ncbi:MAG: DUF565 domain-containing protein [Chlorogloeopsis fritschii C42_A2020_084]|jgi:hypothetical protein|uniref:DUF565 domain-containing protein n=1 Tax=Chlorogloeopsis fritschii TaxID=1124 RepID=UPI0019E90DB7|nr:DUF565 domain-containing protein [Chlorogloeopsis fritschii]MBF2005671.1 DUF565 domain-containing protein [Chlorogloeopsis fritschii C42_A2020_084]
MQNTRLNNLSNVIANRLRLWLLNPWRRVAVILISFLSGFFLGSAIATTAGQTAEWDVVSAAILVVMAEIASRIFYHRGMLARQALWVQSINYLKVGLTYSLFLEAFKLGS